MEESKYLRANRFRHTEHSRGLTVACPTRCRFRCSDRMKLFEHMVQANFDGDVRTRPWCEFPSNETNGEVMTADSRA